MSGGIETAPKNYFNIVVACLQKACGVLGVFHGRFIRSDRAVVCMEEASLIVR